MCEVNTDNHCTAFTVSIDHVDTKTGISAYERSITAMKFVEDDAKPSDFRTPGHMFPLRAVPGGVIERGGHTEATVDLCRLAGLKPCGLCCEIMKDDGTMARKDDLLAFINECIDEYYADGTYDTLWTKWIDASGEGEEAAAAEDAETAE